MKARMEGECPSLAELVEFCEGDQGAAFWLAQQWGKLPATDYRNDTAHALTFYRVTVWGYFEARREEFKAGRKEALFDAIQWAATNGTPIPEWARMPFMEGWSRYKDVVPDDPSAPSESECTLGGAFGINRPENFNKPAARFWGQHASLIWSMVTQRRKAGEKVGYPMFKAIAEELNANPLDLKVYAMIHGLPEDNTEQLMDTRTQKGISAGTVSAYYYEYLRGIKDHEERRKRVERKHAARHFPDLSPGRKR